MHKNVRLLFLISLILMISLSLQSQVSVSAPSDECCRPADCGNAQCYNCDSASGSCDLSAHTGTGTCEPKADGTSCGTNRVCSDGACVAACASAADCGACKTCSADKVCVADNTKTCTTCAGGDCECKSGSCVDKSTSGGGSGSVVCGVKNGDWYTFLDSGGNELDMFYCCPISGVDIDYSAKKYADTTADHWDDCDEGYIGCGFVNSEDRNVNLDKLVCCKATGIGDHIFAKNLHPSDEGDSEYCDANQAVYSIRGNGDGDNDEIEVAGCRNLPTGITVDVNNPVLYDIATTGEEKLCGSGGSICNGDGTCSGAETSLNCPSDCGCNNNTVCEDIKRKENMTECPFDCAPCTNYTLRNAVSPCQNATFKDSNIQHPQCRWCASPLSHGYEPGDLYPYIEPNQDPTYPDTSAEPGFICVNITNDPFNCGACGFMSFTSNSFMTENGPPPLHEYYPDGGFCRTNAPFCVWDPAKPATEAECQASGNTSSYLASHPDANPYYKDYTAVCSADTGCVASVDGAPIDSSILPAINSNQADNSALACEKIAGAGSFVAGLGCCGDDKCRTQDATGSGVHVCQVDKLCDGTSWHVATNAETAGEVFAPQSCFNNQTPIANINDEFVKCIDTDQYYTYASKAMTGEMGGCTPNETEALAKSMASPGASELAFLNRCDDQIAKLQQESPGTTSCATDPTKGEEASGTWPYSCPDNYQQTASVRVYGPSSKFGTCGLHTVNSEAIGASSAYMVCFISSSYADAQGFTGIIDGGTRSLSYKSKKVYDLLGQDERNMDAWCPPAVTEWKAFNGGGDVTVQFNSLTPCPGMKYINTPITSDARGIILTGVNDIPRAATALFCTNGPQVDGWNSGIYNLDFVRGNATIMGNVSNHDYACYTDMNLPPANDPGTRARIGICCGNKIGTGVCGGDIPGTLSTSKARLYYYGDKLPWNGTTLYCLADGRWSEDLDYNYTQDACNRAGFFATGNYCCSEGDDNRTWLKESYNDLGGPGGCFKSTRQDNTFYLKYPQNLTGKEYRNVLVYNGSFQGCGFDNFSFTPEFEQGSGSSSNVPSSPASPSSPSDPSSPSIPIPGPTPPDTPPTSYIWYKGNTHTHTTLSDGAQEPAAVVNWYDSHGYDFLAITDHNSVTPVDGLSTSSFLVISGSELSVARNHVTALGIASQLSTATLRSAITFQQQIDLASNNGAIPIINHPYWSYIIATNNSLNLITSTTGAQHIEIANMGVFAASDEAVWDAVLSTGRQMFGIASDDSHNVTKNSGKGWIMVKAASLTESNILATIRKGDFYSSTGIVLNDYVVNKAAKTITVNSQNGGTIEFIGKNGVILETANAKQATYQVKGNEMYVRARITNSQGQKGWTQPVFISYFSSPTGGVVMSGNSITGFGVVDELPWDDGPTCARASWGWALAGVGAAGADYCDDDNINMMYARRPPQGGPYALICTGGGTGYLLNAAVGTWSGDNPATCSNDLPSTSNKIIKRIPCDGTPVLITEAERLSASYLGVSGSNSRIRLCDKSATSASVGESSYFLQNIEDWPNPGINFTSTSTWRTKMPLINRTDYCTMFNTTLGNYYCSYANNWTLTQDNLSHKSVVPKDLFDYINLTWNLTGRNTSGLRNASCCRPSECWDPNVSACIPEQTGWNEFIVVNDTVTYKCLGGNWTLVSAAKKTPDGCYIGACPNSSQCLLNITGIAADNGNLSGNPQCINSSQYLGDYLCENGTWSTRTKMLALKLTSLVGAGDNFVLMCGPAKNVLVKEYNVGASNNWCALNLNNQRIIATTLNSAFADQSSNLSFIYNALYQTFNFTPYRDMGASFVTACTEQTKDFDMCVDIDASGQELLKLYYDDDYKTVIMSNKIVNKLKTVINCSALPGWLQWLCPQQPLEKNMAQLQLFNKVYAARQGNNREIFGVAEETCNPATLEKKWMYTFNLTGFTSADLSYLILNLAADNASINYNNKNIYIKNPKRDPWLALTIMRNPEQE